MITLHIVNLQNQIGTIGSPVPVCMLSVHRYHRTRFLTQQALHQHSQVCGSPQVLCQNKRPCLIIKRSAMEADQLTSLLVQMYPLQLGLGGNFFLLTKYWFMSQSQYVRFPRISVPVIASSFLLGFKKAAKHAQY